MLNIIFANLGSIPLYSTDFKINITAIIIIAKVYVDDFIKKKHKKDIKIQETQN